LIRASLEDRPDLLPWFDSQPSDYPPFIPTLVSNFRSGFDGKALNIDASKFGVRTIADAVKVAADILNVRPTRIEYDPEIDAHTAAIAGMEAEIESREYAIRKLHEKAETAEVERDTAIRTRTEIEGAFAVEVQSRNDAIRTLENSLSCLPHRIVRKAKQFLNRK